MSRCTELPISFGENVILKDRFYSWERQDEFVYYALARFLDKPGFFLDVACSHPFDGSNTYVLEKYFNWTGIGFDVCPQPEWNNYRKSKFVNMDVLTEEFTSFLKYEIKDQVIDYISLDVDNAGANYALPTLKRILDANVTFKVMTLEHENFKTGTSVTNESRDLLYSLGYDILFKDVSFNDGRTWEDWWVNPYLLPNKNILSLTNSNLNYNVCVDRVKNYKDI